MTVCVFLTNQPIHLSTNNQTKSKGCKPISRVLCSSRLRQDKLLSFIWDHRRRWPLSTYPPAIERDALVTPAYLVFRLARFTPGYGYPSPERILSPVFSPLPFDKLRAVIFCGTLCILLREPHPLGGAIPCAARTFLIPINRDATGWLAALLSISLSAITNCLKLNLIYLNSTKKEGPHRGVALLKKKPAIL